MNDQEFFEHVGVLGMRWGRRKAAATKVTTTTKVSKDHAEKSELSKKKLSELSNAEIKKLNERLQLEKQYREITKKETSAGKKFVMDLLQTTAKQAINAYAKDMMTKQVEAMLKKK